MSDGDIRAALQRLENPLIVDPGFDPSRLQPASLELTLGEEILVEIPHHIKNAYNVWVVEYTSWERRKLPQILRRTDFWLASTVETVRIPTDLVAQVNGKSSLGRQGLVVHQTAGFIDPGFKGNITLELSNVSAMPIRLEPGMPVCQLVFYQMTSPSERPYGSEGLGSHYQGQVGPTRSAA